MANLTSVGVNKKYLLKLFSGFEESDRHGPRSHFEGRGDFVPRQLFEIRQSKHRRGLSRQLAQRGLQAFVQFPSLDLRRRLGGRRRLLFVERAELSATPDDVDGPKRGDPAEAPAPVGHTSGPRQLERLAK